MVLPYLVGGLEHQFYFPINIGLLIIPIDSYFSEGFFPNHQPASILQIATNVGTTSGVALKMSLQAWPGESTESLGGGR